MMITLYRELARGVRRLWGAPYFALFSIVSLGLGLGITTAIYSVIHALVLTPPAIERISEVANIYHWNPAWGMATPSNIALSTLDYHDLKNAQTSFVQITSWKPFRQPLTSDRSSQIVVGEMVEGNYFATLGIKAALGRTIGTDDDVLGATPVVVLSDRLWKQRFGGDSSVIGRAVTLGTHTFIVIGVAPPRFKGLFAPNLLATALWIPLRTAHLVGAPFDESDRSRRELFVRARLRPGATLGTAAAEVGAIGRHIDATDPLPSDGQPRQVGADPRRDRLWHVMPASGVYLHESVHAYARGAMVAVEAIIALVLLVACGNLANLLLARSASHRQEMAVRLALGASRWSLVREQLVESALLTGAGALLAAYVAGLLDSWFLTFDVRLGEGVSTEISAQFSQSVILANVGLTMAAFVVFGVVPALRVTRADVRDSLATDNPTASVPRWRVRRYVIAAQVAVSVVLAAAAVMSVQQLVAYTRLDSGFDLERLALIQLDFRLQKVEEKRAREILDLVLDRGRTQRGVEAIAISSGLPAGLDPPYTNVTPVVNASAGAAQGRQMKLLAASPQIFPVLGIRMVAGRAFDDGDAATGAPVVVLSERAAFELFGTVRNIVGRSLTLDRKGTSKSTEPAVLATVIGITADEGTLDVSANRRESNVYVPFAQHYAERVVLIARASEDPTAVIPGLIELVSRVDPMIIVSDAGTGIGLAGPPMLPLRLTAHLAGFLGVTALLLAVTGLYGVLSYVVAKRTAEIGLRMALGASAARIRRMVLSDGLRPVCGGLVLGMVMTMMVWLSLRPLFVRLLPTTNAMILVGIMPAAFVIVGAMACYFPARRAASVDPNIALRHL